MSIAVETRPTAPRPVRHAGVVLGLAGPPGTSWLAVCQYLVSSCVDSHNLAAISRAMLLQAVLFCVHAMRALALPQYVAKSQLRLLGNMT